MRITSNKILACSFLLCFLWGCSNRNSIIWEYQAGELISVPPLVMDSVVLVEGTEKGIYAVDLKSGTEKWRFVMEGGSSLPAVTDNDILYYAQNHLSSVNPGIFAFDMESGAVRWREDAGMTLNATPHPWGDKVYYTKFDTLYTANKESGAKLAFRKLDGPLNEPAVTEKFIFLTSSGETIFYVLSRDSCKIVSARKNPDSLSALACSSPVIIENHVVFACEDRLFCYDVNDGKFKWSYKCSAPVTSTPAGGDGVIYVKCQDQTLNAVNFQTGQLSWSRKVTADYKNAPCALNKRLYIPDGKKLLVWDELNGKDISVIPLQKEASSPPVIRNNVLYIGCRSSVYAIRLEGPGN